MTSYPSVIESALTVMGKKGKSYVYELLATGPIDEDKPFLIDLIAGGTGKNCRCCEAILILEALLNLCNPQFHDKFNLGEALQTLDPDNMQALLNGIVRTYNRR